MKAECLLEINTKYFVYYWPPWYKALYKFRENYFLSQYFSAAKK